GHHRALPSFPTRRSSDLPPAGAPETVDAAKQAMQIAFFHWGFHIWAIYGLTGLVLSYFSFRHGLPLSMRSALYPIIGERIYGPIDRKSTRLNSSHVKISY